MIIMVINIEAKTIKKDIRNSLKYFIMIVNLFTFKFLFFLKFILDLLCISIYFCHLYFIDLFLDFQIQIEENYKIDF